MIKIYYLPLKEQAWSDIDRSLLMHVSGKRRERILRYHFDPDRRLSLYAALLTRAALCRFLKTDNAVLSFAEDENGRPFLSCPASGIDFNFSHTHYAVLCGITDTGNIGVDIETIREKIPFNVEKKAFCGQEISYIHQDNQGQDVRFFECWTRKEAFTKAAGTGLITDLRSINTMEADESSKLLTRQRDSYICSVCIKHAAGAVRHADLLDADIAEVSENTLVNHFSGNLSSC